jgi:Bacteriophage Lambda NinG protein
MKFPKEKDKPKKLKKKSVSKLKKELDKVFSEYIRRKYANEKGEVSCYTCGLTKVWREQQCGHFISRGYLATRFEEENVRPQCVGCNVFGGGKQVIFAAKLSSERADAIQILYKKAQEIQKWSAKDYEAKISYYQALIK